MKSHVLAARPPAPVFSSDSSLLTEPQPIKLQGQKPLGAAIVDHYGQCRGNVKLLAVVTVDPRAVVLTPSWTQTKQTVKLCVLSVDAFTLSVLAPLDGVDVYFAHTVSLSHQGSKLWGGRFVGRTDPLMEKFNASIAYDQRMWDADIRGSKAYVKALEKAKLVTTEERNQIVQGMDQVNASLSLSVKHTV